MVAKASDFGPVSSNTLWQKCDFSDQGHPNVISDQKIINYILGTILLNVYTLYLNHLHDLLVIVTKVLQ